MTSHSIKAAELFDKYAQVYEEKYMNVSKYLDSLNNFCSLLDKSDSDILELACGPGNLTKALLGIQPALQILATDLAPNMIERAKSNVPKASFKIFDANNIDQLTETYDGIVSGFCTPYLSQKETKKLIENAANRLNKNGLFYLSTMEDDYSKSNWSGPSDRSADRLFMYFHESRQLEEVLLKNNFELMHKENILYFGPDGEEVNDLILIAKKK